MSAIHQTLAMENLLAALEDKRRSLQEKRRSYTRNLVAQSNDEIRSGTPYVVDVAKVISQANATEVFLEGLINGIQSNSITLGEGVAVKRALSAIAEAIRGLGTDDRNAALVPAEELYDISQFILSAITLVVLRDGEL